MYSIRSVKILSIREECDDIKTFFFNLKKDYPESYIRPVPGQFVMVWVPGVDEVPMSISGCTRDDTWSISVKKVGECTAALHEMKVGDYIGIKGPLGNGFTRDTLSKAFLVGGGIGMAPLQFLAAELYKHNRPFLVVQGTKTKSELAFDKCIGAISDHIHNVHYCTDDGTFGQSALATDVLDEVIRNHLEDEDAIRIVVYACGPEKMLVEALKVCEKHGVEMQASLERMMRCGCGLCGLCAMDPTGDLVCKDGPVFPSEKLKQMDNFGKTYRDITGKEIPI
jgi:dihydroorotate dehydrogenase electron transfer subunit